MNRVMGSSDFDLSLNVPVPERHHTNCAAEGLAKSCEQA